VRYNKDVNHTVVSLTLFGVIMFKIELIDIGGDGLVTEKKTTVETLPECEVVIRKECCIHLGIMSVTLVHEGDLVYSVWVNGRKVGVVTVTVL